MISSKNALIFPADGDLYILKQTHFFFEIVWKKDTIEKKLKK